MTAHRPKPTITPEIVARFAAYYGEGFPTWGAFVQIFDDADYSDATLAVIAGRPLNAEERHLANLLAILTFSQRKRLGEKVKAYAAQGRAA